MCGYNQDFGKSTLVYTQGPLSVLLGETVREM